jgi:DTW domain-containing protein YfiP
MRDLCLECRRARAHCWCAEVAPFDIGFDLALLMHPKEARVAIGTGRMAHRSVRGSKLLVGEAFDDARLSALTQRPDRFPVLLFPAPDALDLSTCTPTEAAAFFPPARRPLVLVVDGTWTTAKKVLRLSPTLMTLPAIKFTPTTRARYDRLRKEPRLECHSTLESIHALIDHLDHLGIAQAPAQRRHDGMLAMLERLVVRQEAYVPEAHRKATRGAREGKSSKIEMLDPRDNPQVSDFDEVEGVEVEGVEVEGVDDVSFGAGL